jgi:hypothetical protein
VNTPFTSITTSIRIYFLSPENKQVLTAQKVSPCAKIPPSKISSVSPFDGSSARFLTIYFSLKDKPEISLMRSVIKDYTWLKS